MSPRVNRPVAFSGSIVACVLALIPPLAAAQTIADYSRAQRTLLENTMVQAAARSAGLGSSTAASAPASSSVAGTILSTVAPAPHVPSAMMAPAVQVSGVFASKEGVVAEIVVNATPYLLCAGQGVPGTAWYVESVAIDRVVLSRRGGVLALADAETARKVFALPALAALPAPR